MPYFTACLARSGTRWVARDIEVDTGDEMADVAGRMRAAAFDDQPVLLIVEHEDEWFALVRVDGEEDPRVFLSDVPSVSTSAYAGLLSSEDVEPEPLEPLERTDEDDDEGEPDITNIPAGDAEVLGDFGVPAKQLRELCEDGLPPADTLAEVASSAGFEELLDSLR